MTRISYIVFFVLIYLMTHSSFGQVRGDMALDSLQALDSRLTNSDRNSQEYFQVRLDMNALMKSYLDFNGVLENSLELIEPAKRKENESILLKVYSDVVEAYVRVAQLDSARLHANNYLLVLDELKNNTGRAVDYELVQYELIALRQFAELYFELGDYENANAYIEQAIELIERIDLEKARESYPGFAYGEVYAVRGATVQYMDNPKNETTFYDLAREDAEFRNDKALLSTLDYWSASHKYDIEDYYSALKQLDNIDISTLGQVYPIYSWDYHILKTHIFFEQDQLDSMGWHEHFALLEVLRTDLFNEIQYTFSALAQLERANKNYRYVSRYIQCENDYYNYVKTVTDQRNLGRLETALESERVQNQLNYQIAAQRNQKTLIIFGALALLIINIFVVRSLKISRKARRLEKIENEKLEADRQIEELKKEKLSSILEFKNRQLATTTLSTERLNSQFDLMIGKLEQVRTTEDLSQWVPQIDTLLRELKSANNSKDNWAQFYKHFESVHPDFFNRLIEINSDLTQNELRHCAYVLMNLSNKEVAHMYNISPNSVKTAKNRLKKKLGIAPEASLTDFIHQLSDIPGGQYLKQA